jgi:anti-anti-sigma factor
VRWPLDSDRRAHDAPFFVAQTDEHGPFELHGELDVDTLAVLDELPVQSGPGRRVVLDLQALTFVDSSGMRGLLELRRRIIDPGGHLVLRRPRPNVRRVLEVSGLDEVFTVEEDASAAGASGFEDGSADLG